VSTDQHHQCAANKTRGHARRMRRVPTDAEQAMWHLLRDRRLSGFKFRRQVPFRNYILDFVCFERRLIVEVDGGQHAESSSDIERDRILRREGFEIVRYWNNDVLAQRMSVLEDLFERLRGCDK
jgi:very-short-patch-repair endonuclease